MISDECGERTKQNAGHELEGPDRGFVKTKQKPEVREKCSLHLKIWMFFLQKCMDSLQEAFIYPPEPCEACFIMDAHT